MSAERAWIRGAQQGSVADLERLFREHWPRAYRAAHLITGDAGAAEDIAQEAFLAAVRNLDRFDRRRPFAPWLHRIVVNRAIDWTRARKLRAEVQLGDYLPAPGVPEPDGTALGRIAELAPEQRAVVVLRYVLEYTPGEIAELLDLPRGTVNSRLRRGLDSMKDELVNGPAEQRAWEVVRLAFEERTPAPRRKPARVSLVLAAVGVVAAAIVVAALSPPGRAVIERVRKTVGIEHAEPALFSLPAPGRLLVVSAEGGGVWLVHDNGYKRRIGSYDDAQWSPHGLFLAATEANELVALDAAGNVHWSLARRGARWPRWEGTRTDTRIAYFAQSGLRVVAGDGTGDRLLDARAGDVPAAWDPARLHTLAYYSGGAIVLRNADTGRIVWRSSIGVLPTKLEWSDDGRELAVVSAKRIVVLNAAGSVVPDDHDARSRAPGRDIRAGVAPARGRHPPRRPERSARRRRRPPGTRDAALRGPRRLRRHRLVAEREVAARLLANRESVALPARQTRARGRQHRTAVPARGPPRACAPGSRTLVLHELISRHVERRRSNPRSNGLPRAERAGDDRRARRGRPQAARLLPVRLVIHLNERDGAPA